MTGLRRRLLGDRPLRTQAREALAERLTPERTREPTPFERRTVCRLSWQTLIRLNGSLEVVGRAATVLWVAAVVAAAVGVDWRGPLGDSASSGGALRSTLVTIGLASILALVAIRSLLGFARWRVQRELWRRDVARLRRGELSRRGRGS